MAQPTIDPLGFLTDMFGNLEDFGKGPDSKYIRCDRLAPGMSIRIDDEYSVVATGVRLIDDITREVTTDDGNVLKVLNSMKVEVDD